MTRVSITAENPGTSGGLFRAAARGHESVGPTPGAALDALAEQLGEQETNTLIVVQSTHPDQFFTSDQQRRLGELLAERRAALDVGQTMNPAAAAELESLVDAELHGATRRAAAMIDELRS
jgi:hypothetical protein